MLRVWGTGSDAIEQSAPPMGECSYAFLSFPVEPLDIEAVQVTEAKLIIHIQKTEALDPTYISEFPMEVRALDANFDEKTFKLSDLKKGPEATVFGKSGKPEPVGDDKYKLTINLMGKDSQFGVWFQKFLHTKQMPLALTTTMPSAEGGNFYRVFSKESSKALVPRLIVKYGPRR